MNIEPLEYRIAPASLTFTDVDGDKVVITTSGPGTLTLGGNVLVNAGQLEQLILLDPAFQGTNVSILATHDPLLGGDGHVNVGRINATARDLGAVVVDGDLGQIVAGDAGNPAPGLKSLQAVSLGQLGTITGAAGLVVEITGDLGALKIAGDVHETFVSADKIGSVTIGGSVIGGATEGSGLIESRGDMGRVKVGGDLVGGAGNASGTIYSGNNLAGVTVGGSVLGGAHPGGGSFEDVSGAIYAEGTLGPVKIAGNVRGSSTSGGAFSGAIVSLTQIESVQIGGSLAGSDAANSGIITTFGLCGPVTIKGDIVGGAGNNSGVIDVNQDIASVTVGGSVFGDRGVNSGSIYSRLGELGPVKIGGDIVGGRNSFTGRLFGKTDIASVTVGGSLMGGHKQSTADVVDDSGTIASDGAIGPVKIVGNIVGAEGSRSGLLDAGTTLGAVTLGGSLFGGGGAGFVRDTGSIHSGAAMGFVKIGRDIVAGEDTRSGLVEAGGTLAGITVGGSLLGDSARQGLSSSTGIAAEILSTGAMGPVKIVGDIIGGDTDETGRIVSMSSIASITLGGSLIAGVSFTGAILSTGALGPVKIGGDIIGSDNFGFGAGESGYIEAQRIASLFVGGSIRAGVDRSFSALTHDGSVRAVDDIGPIVIKGSLIGSVDADGDSADGDFKPVIISAGGQAGLGATAKTDVAIKSITIGGRVEFAQILAGYDVDLAPKNADAQIGAINIGGDMIGSSIVAGATLPEPTTGVSARLFGAGVKDNLDVIGAVSKIASVVIKGSAFGSPVTNDPLTFAIAAQQLGKLTVGGTAIPRNPGPSNDPLGLATVLGPTRGATTDGFDFHAFEI